MVILVLLTISNNLSIRALGGARWKGIQRWSYVGAALVIEPEKALTERFSQERAVRALAAVAQ